MIGAAMANLRKAKTLGSIPDAIPNSITGKEVPQSNPVAEVSARAAVLSFVKHAEPLHSSHKSSRRRLTLMTPPKEESGFGERQGFAQECRGYLAGPGGPTREAHKGEP